MGLRFVPSRCTLAAARSAIMASTAYRTARPATRRADEANGVSTTAPLQMRTAAQRTPLSPARLVLPARPQTGIGLWANGASLGFPAHRDPAAGEGGSATIADKAHPTARLTVRPARALETRAPEG